MSLLWWENFSQYNPNIANAQDVAARSGQQALQWNTVPSGSSLAVGPFGVGQCLVVPAASVTGSTLYGSIAGNRTQFTMGFRMVMNDDVWLTFANGQYSGGVWPQFTLQYHVSNGSILVNLAYSPANPAPIPPGYANPPSDPGYFPQIGVAPANSFNPGVWQFFEVGVDLSAGTLVLKVNNKVVYSSGSGTLLYVGSPEYSAGSPYSTPAALIDTLLFHNSYGSFSMTDFYGTGSETSDPGTFPNTGFLGNVRALTQYPNGAGSSTEFVPGSNTGTTYANYQMVNGQYSTGDASYVQADAAAETDMYTVTSLSTAATQAIAVVLVGCAEQTDAGDDTITLKISSSGTVASGATHNLTSGVYNYFSDPIDTDPHTSSSWSISQLNSGNVQIGQVSG